MMWSRSVFPLNGILNLKYRAGGKKVNGHPPSLPPEFEDFTPPPNCSIYRRSMYEELLLRYILFVWNWI